MKLSKIEKQKKKANRYSLYIDDEFWMGVDESVLIQFGLLKAQEIDQRLMEAIRQAEFEQGVYAKALHHLSYAMKTRSEVETYLNTRYQEEMDQSPENYEALQGIIQASLDKLESMGYLDDSAYVTAYLNTQATLSPKGPKILRYDLLKKGIDKDLIEEALSQMDYQDLVEGALYLSEKLVRSKSRLPIKKQREKVRELLYRKGYDQDIISSVLEELVFEEDEDLQSQLLEKEGQKALQKFARRYEGYELKAKVTESLTRKGYPYDSVRDWVSLAMEE